MPRGTQALFLWISLTAAVSAPAGERYVSPAGGHVPPFTNWANAATNIQAAIDAAAAGDVVWVTNGLYNTGGVPNATGATTNRIRVSKSITVRSVNGPEFTIIEGRLDTTDPNSRGSVRCAWLTTGAVLSGFTLRGGGTTSLDNRGGGCLGGTLTNCVLVGNTATIGGGAASAGLFNCLLCSNTATLRGGGAANCQTEDSVFCHNTALGTTNQGGGGVSDGCVARRCRFVANSTPGSGGGAWKSTLMGCALQENAAGFLGGASYSNTLQSCTLTWNHGAPASCADMLTSCIVWDNRPGNVESPRVGRYTCCWPLLAGSGNTALPRCWPPTACT